MLNFAILMEKSALAGDLPKEDYEENTNENGHR